MLLILHALHYRTEHFKKRISGHHGFNSTIYNTFMWPKIKLLSQLDERSSWAEFLSHSKVSLISRQSCLI